MKNADAELINRMNERMLYVGEKLKVNHRSEEDSNHRVQHENLETGELLLIRSNPPYIKEAENEAIKNYHENNN